MTLAQSAVRRLYRRCRPTLTSAYRRTLGSNVIDHHRLREDPLEGYRVFDFGDVETYTFTQPCHTGQLPQAIDALLGDYQIDRPFVVEVENASIVGPSALVCTDHHLLLESARGSYPRLIDASLRSLRHGQIPWHTRLQRPGRRFDSPVFSLVGPWDREYYHWIVDYLVRVFALEVYRERTRSDPDILIPSDPPNWMTDSLELAGIDLDRTVEWSGGRANAPACIVGSVRFHTDSTDGGYIHSPEALENLGDRIRSAVGCGEGKGTSRLYISRADAEDRRVQNETELMDTLSQFGFERYVPGRHSFAEQVRRFASSEAILGPHGAGLTNMIFANDIKCFELFGNYTNPCFFGLAQGLGHDYVSISCVPAGCDMRVDVDAVQPLLDSILE